MKCLNIEKGSNYYKSLDKQYTRNNIWLYIIGFLFVCLCFSFGSLLKAYYKTWHPNENRYLTLTQHDNTTFPPDFLIGCATSAYQIEGAWNVEGKGENIWDVLVHKEPSVIYKNETGDVACDSYHMYNEDVQIIKDIGFSHYRFSIAWSRVLPTGYDNVINPAGLKYYHNLIDQLHARGIEPMVTLYHWDLPQPLQEIGGWANPLIADHFEAYARVMFKEFASKVKWWVTLNEPKKASSGYGLLEIESIMAPLIRQSGVGDYLALHTMIRAHAKAYRLYERDFKPTYGGKVSIVMDAQYIEPKSSSEEDKMAAKTALEFEVDLVAHPIFSKEGDYPKSLKELIKRKSNEEGRSVSRLPSFTTKEIEEIRGSYDFFGLNHYTTYLASPGDSYDSGMYHFKDAGVVIGNDPSWPQAASGWLKVVPWGFRKLLNYIRLKYDNPAVFITENGFSSNSGLEDYDRIQYYHDYLQQMLKSMHEDGCNVIGYTIWSILDNFEWGRGYSERFGVVYVDFEDPKRRRTAKLSADYFKKLIQLKKLPPVDSNVTDPYSIIDVNGSSKYDTK